MATSEVTLKLLIDTRNEKVLFAEAGKDFVDFLFSIFALPLGSVTCLLETKSMVGSLGNLYQSIRHFSQTYIQQGTNMDSVLKPTISASDIPRLLPKTDSYFPAPEIYLCPNEEHNYAADRPNVNCPDCKTKMSIQMTSVSVAATNNTDNDPVVEGFVKDSVTYMVTDSLEVTPMSGISSIMLLNKFNINDLSALEEKTVNCGMTEGLNLLKASMHTKSVLTNTFLGNKGSGVSSGRKRRNEDDSCSCSCISFLEKLIFNDVFF